MFKRQEVRIVCVNFIFINIFISSFFNLNSWTGNNSACLNVIIIFSFIPALIFVSVSVRFFLTINQTIVYICISIYFFDLSWLGMALTSVWFVWHWIVIEYGLGFVLYLKDSFFFDNLLPYLCVYLCVYLLLVLYIC